MVEVLPSCERKSAEDETETRIESNVCYTAVVVDIGRHVNPRQLRSSHVIVAEGTASVRNDSEIFQTGIVSFTSGWSRTTRLEEELSLYCWLLGDTVHMLGIHGGTEGKGSFTTEILLSHSLNGPALFSSHVFFCIFTASVLFFCSHRCCSHLLRTDAAGLDSLCKITISRRGLERYNPPQQETKFSVYRRVLNIGFTSL